jgi:hypothetical protein
VKVRFWVVSEKGTSLRDRLNGYLSKDRKRESDDAKYQVRLKRRQKHDRRSGWSWVHSRGGGKGVVRYRWNPRLKILECWAVTKVGNRPSQIIGEFVETLLDSQRVAIKSIHIDVG